MGIPDQEIRHAAVSEPSANVVVTAGAGTGKTTLLVDRILHLLFREQNPILIGEIVALTFMNKAAQEIKLRLRERLAVFQELDFQRPPSLLHEMRDWELLQRFREDYHLTQDHLHQVTKHSLSEIETSQIGTIHSFAAHILHLYPLESHIAPDFQEDDGSKFSQFLDKEWGDFLEQELGPFGLHHTQWKHILSQLDLSDLFAFTKELLSELNPLHRIRHDEGLEQLSPSIHKWLETLIQESGRLGDVYSTLTLGRMMSASSRLFQEIIQHGDHSLVDAADNALIERTLPGITKSCTQDDYHSAKQLVSVAQSLQKISIGGTTRLLELLCPFIERTREKFIQSGFVTFDGLLVKSRDLLRDHVTVRQELKRKYKAILVDEFQDTDPVQYEMIMFLGEQISRMERDWQNVHLTPGKLFIVGDPKQSIYGFRRADMEAFDVTVQDKILGNPAPSVSYSLETNFRSHYNVLSPVNDFFTRAFPSKPQRGIQPGYEPLKPAGQGQEPLCHEGLEIRLIQSASQDPDSDEATRVEAQELARWLKEEVIAHQTIREQGVETPIQPKHIALLLRTLTSARFYVDALRNYDIPCISEGEKHFYKRQEVIDTINLLRSAAFPYDQGAFVGVLRSSVGCIPDTIIARLAEEARLTYLAPDQALPSDLPDPLRDSLHSTLALLQHLHTTLPLLPLPDMIRFLFHHVPLRALAAASLDQEQAMGNLGKLERIMIDLSLEEGQSFLGLVNELSRRIFQAPDESEQSLSEDDDEGYGTTGAIRLLSIHKAKGLEFPIVILGGLHKKLSKPDSKIFVAHDWGSSVFGFRAANIQSLNGVFLQAKQRQRERAEQTRVLYVGMTRAKRRLILSAGLTKQVATDSYLALLENHMGFKSTISQSTLLQFEGSSIPLSIQKERPSTNQNFQVDERKWKNRDDNLSDLQKGWDARKARWRMLQAVPKFSNPTALSKENSPTKPIGFTPERSGERNRQQRRLIGTIAHRLLETWDFSHSSEEVAEVIERCCRKEIPPKWESLQGVIREDLGQMFNSFFKTTVYTNLQSATILGREVPFSFLHKPGDISTIDYQVPFVLEGVIDILYKKNGMYYIGDYKTDNIPDRDLAERVESYRCQAEVYREAIQRVLSIDDLRFEFIFLRNGKSFCI